MAHANAKLAGRGPAPLPVPIRSLSPRRDRLDKPQKPHIPSILHLAAVQLQMPSRLEWIDPTIRFLTATAIRWGVCDEDRAFRVELAMHEALTNSVVHGNLGVPSSLKEVSQEAFAEELAKRSVDPLYADRQVLVEVDFDGAVCRWSITDEGEGFPVDRVMREKIRASEGGDDVDPEQLLASGRGIMMMMSFLDEVNYELGGRRLILKMNTGSEGRRRSRRMPFGGRLRLVPCDDAGAAQWSEAYTARARDLSDGGIGLKQTDPPPSSRVLVQFGSDEAPSFVPAAVCHWRQDEEGLVYLGCRFERGHSFVPTAERALTSAEEATAASRQQIAAVVTDLLEQRSGGQVRSDSRRRHERRQYAERLQYRALPDGAWKVAFARDLSAGGIAFVATESVPTPEIAVRLAQPDGNPVTIVSRVVRCRSVTEGFYDTGCQFLRWPQRDDD